MKATDLLEKQHRELERIFDRIRSGEGPLHKLVDELADTLVAHQVMEEQLFYPSVAEALKSAAEPLGERSGDGAPRKDPLVLKCVEEHALCTIALRRLLATEPDESAFEARVTVLRELLLSHVTEEEEELFPRVLEAVDEEMLVEMGTQLEELYEATKSRGHAAILSGEETRRERRPKVRTHWRGRTAVN